MKYSFLLKNNIKINYDGIINKFNPVILEELYYFILLTFVTYIFNHYNYYHVTLTGHTDYSLVLSSFCSSLNVSYKICGTNIKIYHQVSGKDFNIISPDLVKEEELPLIALDYSEIKSLENHTGLKNLNEIQDFILSGNDSFKISKEEINLPLLGVRRLFKDFWLLSDKKSVWISKILISDKVENLNPGDIIIGLKIKRKENNGRDEIQRLGGKVLVQRNNIVTILGSKDIFKVDDNYQIIKNKKFETSSIFSLKNPRRFYFNGIFFFHSFHFPHTKDFIMSMLIIMMKILNLIK